MILHLEYLRIARTLLINLLERDIIKDELNESLSQLKIMLKSSTTIYIRYNEYGEYGYQIIHSHKKNDFSRFDNFDDRWEVETRPHHLHIRGKNEVVESGMNGNPKEDIPLLVEYIKKLS